jgi:hypothetical protein
MRGHVYELVLPPDRRETYVLPIGSVINISNDGDPEPFCTIERIGRGETRVTFRTVDEHLTAADLELLTSEPVPA